MQHTFYWEELSSKDAISLAAYAIRSRDVVYSVKHCDIAATYRPYIETDNSKVPLHILKFYDRAGKTEGSFSTIAEIRAAVARVGVQGARTNTVIQVRSVQR